jgi:hypothetical protein
MTGQAGYLRYVASMLTDNSPIPTAGDRAMWRSALEAAADKIDDGGTLLDQGISRLQLHAFLRGDTSDYWNGSNDYPWIRYRAHQIDRNPTPDGNLFRLTHRNIGDTDRTANFLTRADSDEDALVTARMIDQIIDAVIAEYGTDGVA